MGVSSPESVLAQPDLVAEAEQFLQGVAFRVEDIAQQERQSQESFSQFLGAVSLQQEVVIQDSPEQTEDAQTTLAEAIDLAVNGKGEVAREAECVVDINVGTAVVEGYFKKNHRTEVEAELNGEGEVVQFGKTKRQINFNSIIFRPDRDPRLQEFTKAEALNAFREEELIRAGLLRENVLVVPSLVPDQIDEALIDHRGDGYFTSSMSFCLQGTTLREGKVVTESIFDVGTDAPDTASYEDRVAGRFDIAALGLVYQKLGLPAPASPLEFLQTPLLIPKDRLPNGMVDFLRMVHEAADEVRGLPFKQRSEQDYTALIADSKRREESLIDTRALVKQRLLEHAGTFTQPMDAIQKLWDLVKEAGVEAAATNQHIDPMAFGQAAAEHINQARHFAAINDYDAMSRMIDKAQEVAVVSGCGGGSVSKGEGGGEGSADDSGTLLSRHFEDKFGSLEFKCQKGHTNFRPPNQLIPRCKVCGISVRC